VDAQPNIVVTRQALLELAARALRERCIALDLEANGRFAYRARISTLQVGFADGDAVIIDPLAPDIAGDLSPLAPLLSSEGPIKIIHDVGFDARLLAQVGLTMGNVHDTALAAQWLGRPATGLASLALAELGQTLDKSLQAQDWGARPLSERSLRYLVSDVGHLFALDDRFWGEATALDITAEILEETAYRMVSGARAVTDPDPRPAYTRAKGADALPRPDLAVFRRLYEARETEAERLDTPSGELTPTAVLIAAARARPATRQALAKVRAPIARLDAERIGAAYLEAIAIGIREADIEDADWAWIRPPPSAPGVIKARRDREARLSQWRKAAALARKVNDQVILPGHCASEIAGSEPKDLHALSQIAGFGAFRVARYGEAILAALREPPPP